MAYSSTGACQKLNDAIDRMQDKVHASVVKIEESSDNIRGTSEKTFNKISEFKDGMMLGEQKQLAHENSLRVDQELKEQFGDHDAIRKTVMGVVRDFDINLVRNSTIQEMSEELWITSSRYWLSYALLAITAWVNDYQEVAQNAVKECVRRNPQRADLFFCLMNLRFGRNETARRWFKEYLKVLNPEALSQIDAILLQAYLNGLFGKDKALEFEVNQVIQKWIAILNSNKETQEAMVGAYYHYFENMAHVRDCNYDPMKDVVSCYPDIQKSFRDVSKYEIMVQNVESLNVEMAEQTDENYKARVDKVLKDLISTFDEEEQMLINEKKYYETIMAHGGDEDAAGIDFKEQQTVNADVNIGMQMIRWAVYSNSDEVNEHVRKFALQNTRDWYLKALEKWNIKLQENLPVDYPMSIDLWRGVSNATDLESMEVDMRNYYNSNKMNICYLNTANIAALILLILSAALAFVSVYSLIVTAACIVFLVIRIIKANSDFPKRVETAVNILRACIMQLRDFRMFFENEIRLKDRLVNDLRML